MLPLLTAYLLQCKQVFIPHIGTFELRYQPAVLNFADRIIHPPVSQVVFQDKGSITRDLLAYLAQELRLTPDSSAERLNSFGLALRSKIAESSFRWNGFGEMRCENDTVVFHSFEPALLKPVVANKVIRENVHHGVLVGEKEMNSGDTSYMQEEAARERSYNGVIGWALLFLALCFVVFQLYQRNFHPNASGLQQRPSSSILDLRPRI